MNSADSFQIELLRLADGNRLLRVVDPATFTALERRLDPSQPVARQKAAVVGALQGILERELKAVAA